jgi:hypothetical protein
MQEKKSFQELQRFKRLANSRCKLADDLILEGNRMRSNNATRRWEKSTVKEECIEQRSFQ